MQTLQSTAGGQRLEDDIGLYYYGARWSPGKAPGTGNPAAGRLIQADTDVPKSQGVQAWDRYAHVNNNPIRYIDPSGQSYCESKYADPEVCAEIDPDGDQKSPWPWSNPLDDISVINQYYGGDHIGLDYAVDAGDNVYSTTFGTIVVADYCNLDNCVVHENSQKDWRENGGYGNVVIIEYNAESIPQRYRSKLGISEGESIYMLYGHLSKIYVNLGDKVTAHETIGLAGDTGNSTGPHLHVEVRIGPSGFIPPGPFATYSGYYGGPNRGGNWFSITPTIDPMVFFN
jgi:RHS repeat-associated protein